MASTAPDASARAMSLADPFTLCILAIVALSLLGLPIGHAMIGGSILYLWLAGLDMGTAAEQLLNGMYTSYILLAVPLFILAAELMNSGTHDRAAAALLRRAGRPLPRRPRPGQRRAERSSSPACRARRSPTPPAPAS